MLYSGSDERVQVTTDTTPRRFVYDESGRLIGEYGNTGTVNAEHIWLMPDTDEGGWEPLALLGASTISYVHADHLGVPVVITNATGTSTNDMQAEPFGRRFATASGTAPRTAMAFPGQIIDIADRHYNMYRDYDPTLGRYLQADPIGLGGGDNVYGHVGGNPVGRVDPEGLLAWGVIFGGADIAWQLYRNGGNFRCIKWGEVGLSMLGGGLLNALGKGAFAFKTAGSHTWNAISKWMNRRGIQKTRPGQVRHHWLIEQNQGLGKNVNDATKNQPWNTNPISPEFNNWLSRRPALAWLGGPSWAGEVLAGGTLATAGGYDCTCQQ